MSERHEIECALNEKRTEDGTRIEGHAYGVPEVHRNCVVEIVTCKRCGHVSVGWYPEGCKPVVVKPGDPLPDVGPDEHFYRQDSR